MQIAKLICIKYNNKININKLLINLIFGAILKNVAFL